MIRALSFALCITASQASSADLYFCWIGANGYTMNGEMTVPDSALQKPRITQDDVTHFKITGFLNETVIGSWDMADRTEDTTWVLNYAPQRGLFLPGDALISGYSQGWNADGRAEDCGNPGFGFNSGGYAQDFCLNGVWIEESGVPPQTPFLVSPTRFDPLCRNYAPLS